MIRRVLVSAGLVVAALTVFISVTTAQSSAQSNNDANNANGLRISPVRSDLTIKPGASQVVDVYLRNISATAGTFKGVINDFTASDDESGQPRVLLNDTDFAPRHGLKRYVDSISEFTLQPQEQKTIKVRVAMPANAAGGGYFGVVRFLPIGVNESENVSLSASVGSLVLVTVPGDIKEQMGVESLNVSRGDKGKASSLFTNGKDLKTTVRFKNNGNVQLAPFGKINLKKSNKVLASFEVNNTTPHSTVLPDSIRRFTLGLSDKPLGFGRYTVEGNFGYGSSGQLLTARTSFFVVPMPILISGLIVLALLVLAAVALPRMLKSHDRKLIRKLRRSKRQK